MHLRVVPSVIVAALIAGGTVSFAASRAPAPIPLRVVKSPTCGCCQKWIDYMKAQGFAVTVENRDEFTALKRANGVTRDLESCHTAFAGDIVIEGHVPADLVKKLLTEKPAGVKGLAVPGMPMGSPGMEGSMKDRYTIYTFTTKGHAKPYATR